MLKELESGEETQVGKNMFPLTPKSKKCPPQNLCPNVEIFVRLVTEDLKSIPSFTAVNNLNSSQQRALKELQQRKDVVIKPAEKGGDIVLWPVSMYEREAFRQLREDLPLTPLPHFRGNYLHW